MLPQASKNGLRTIRRQGGAEGARKAAAEALFGLLPTVFRPVFLAVFLLMLSAPGRAAASSEASASSQAPLVIGVVADFGLGHARGFADASVEAVAKAVRASSGREVVVKNIVRELFDGDALARTVDIVLAPADVMAALDEADGFVRIGVRAASATSGSSLERDAAAAFVVREARTDMRVLSDLRGKRVAAAESSGLSGWLAALGVVRAAGFDEERFFSEIHFTTSALPDVFSAVATGMVDAGVLPVCGLERAEAAGLIPRGILRVLGDVSDGAGCRRSTPVYPGTVAAATTRAPDADVKAAAKALLSMPSVDGAEWAPSAGQKDVYALLKELKLGPYAYLRTNTLTGFLEAYGRWVAAVAALIALLLVNEWLLRRRVRRQAGALKRAMDEKAETERRAADARERLSALESRGTVSHLSTIIAHEIKQPLAAIINRCHTVKMRLNEPLNDDDESAEAMERIEANAERIAAMVDRVRQYAKREDVPMKETDLAGVLRAAAEVAVRDLPEAPTVALELPSAPLVVWGCALELDLLFLNLIKNGMRAAGEVATGATGAPEPGVVARALLQDEGVVVTVENRGAPVSDDVFSALTRATPGFTSAAGGLGLGLSIVRLIADRHGAEIAFVRRREGGLAVTVRFGNVDVMRGRAATGTPGSEAPKTKNEH